MSDHPTRIASLRCPVCYVREIDVLLLHDGSEYYCVKCSYRGTPDEVRGAHQHARAKYKNITRRLTTRDIESL